MAEYQKPLPDPTWVEAKEFWQGCKRHELWVQRCQDCDTYRWYPRPMCHQCSSMNVQWVKVSGRGKVYSYTVVAHPTGKVWEREVPYILVMVELEEGVRLMSNLVHCRPEEVKVGMPVRVVFEDVTDEITLPKFTPAS